MGRQPGPSVRLKLTLSYAGFLVLAGILLLAVGWAVFLRDLPDVAQIPGPDGSGPRLLVRAELARDFVAVAAAVLAFLLLVGLAGGWFLAGRVLAPLARLTAATRLAAEGSLSHRVDLAGRADEFRELADGFDTMLSRLEAQLAEQQRFAANASHELRTPLAVTRTLLDVAHEQPPADSRELVERLRSVNTRAIELTEALLLLSRASSRAFTPEAVDLSLLAEEAVETLLPLAEARHVVLEAAGDAAVTPGSRSLLLQLATNLVHNAILHNCPSGGAVRVTTTVDRDGAELAVENTGQVVSPQDAATLFEPFRRGSGRVRSDDTGVGLGLAIARSIVQAHDGRITLTPRPGGGLAVAVRLPRADGQVGQLTGRRQRSVQSEGQEGPADSGPAIGRAGSRHGLSGRPRRSIVEGR